MMPHTISVQRAEALAEVAIDEALIEQAAFTALQQAGVSDPCELAVYVTTSAEIHELNRTYRNIDAPTDVLSFADDGADVPFVTAPDQMRYLGDIAISWAHVVDQAAEYGHSQARELAFLTVHGVLHLLGYDHERGEAADAEMRAMQQQIMAVLQLPRE